MGKLKGRRPSPALLVAVVALVAALAGTTALSTTMCAEQAEAAFPGKNREIAFDGARGPEDLLGIWSTDPSSPAMDTLSLNVTSFFDPTSSPYDPAWSPNGRKIAYVDEHPALDGGAIFTMNARGDAVRRRTGAGAAYPAWSPDGKWIVFTRFFEIKSGLTSEIYKTKAKGGPKSTKIRLTKNKVFDYMPAWSTRGRIAFVREPDLTLGNTEILSMKANGKKRRQLTQTDGLSGPEEYEYNPNWSPNGKKIAFDSTTTTGAGIGLSTMKANGFKRRRLTVSFGEAPAWSPNGKKISFAQGPIYTAKIPRRGQISVAAIVQETDPGGYSDQNPDWRPKPKRRRK